MLTKSKPKQLKPKVLSSCSFRLERQSGFTHILGIDEVGRGCLAGPVVVAGVLFSNEIWESSEPWIEEINDSKKLKAEARERLSQLIISNAKFIDIKFCTAQEVDSINILQATFRAARGVVEQIEKKSPIDCIFIDGNQKIPLVRHRQHPIVGGDAVSKSIAAASIVAKVYRDNLMDKAATEYPGYKFECNKGYGTKDHLEALQRLGICSLHRKSFLKKLMAQEVGVDGERLVAQYLEKNGFKIVDTNWKRPQCEIDIVAEKSGEIHFFEVRSRTQEVPLMNLFPSAKQNQFKRAAEIYLATNIKAQSLAPRLHLVSVIGAEIQPHWDAFSL